MKVPKLWTAYTQCIGGELDAVTGVVTGKNPPGQSALIVIDTF